MVSFLARRVAFIVLTILVASIIIFFVTQLLPGDVAQIILGQFATESAIANLEEELGLNKPLHIQYINWFGGFIRGDWGNSLVSRMPVRPIVMQRLGNSAKLAILALMIYVPLGIIFGVVSALKRDRMLDQIISGVSMTFVGLPEFVSGLLLIALFAFSLKWFPANSSIEPEISFFKAIPFLILPATTVSLTNLGYVTRMTRSATIDVLKTDYIRAAELKGLPAWQVLVKHVLRNSLLPTITVVAMGIGWLIGGLIVTEAVFGYPGLGRLIVYSIQRQDLTVIQASCMIIVAVYSIANLLADILYSLLNPRIRIGN